VRLKPPTALVLLWLAGLNASWSVAAPAPHDRHNRSKVPAARQAITQLQARAEGGDAEAQNRLGEKYLTGEGIDQNKEVAVLWFRKSARQGNADAMCNLGIAYYNGAGVAINDSLSLAWFLAAQKAGCERAAEAVPRAESELSPWAITKAYELLADMYQQGEALPHDQAEALRWWQKAASRGDTDVELALALIFLEGNGVPQDVAQGRHWCQELQQQHKSEGAYCFGYIYQHGLEGAADAAKARKFYTQAIAGHYVPAMRALAGMEARGEGGKIDRVSASLLYARLAARGDHEALQSLATIKRQMSPKDWKQVESQFHLFQIDPRRIENDLDRLGPG